MGDQAGQTAKGKRFFERTGHIQIVVGNETQNKAFTRLDRDNLASLMLNKLRQKKNDEALLEGVNFVFTRWRATVGPCLSLRIQRT